MPPIRIYVMRPLGPAAPWHVSVNGSEGESFADDDEAVRAARDMAHRLGRGGWVVEVRQETPGGQWVRVWLRALPYRLGAFRSEREKPPDTVFPSNAENRPSPTAARSSSATCSKPAP